VTLDPLHPQPGSSIDPRNAVGRSATTERARRELLADNNLALNDPRRMGKTVWLDLFCAAPGPGLTAVKIDYEGVGTTDEFLLRTVEGLSGFASLPQRARKKLRALFEGLEVTGTTPVAPVGVKVGVSSRTAIDLLGETIRSVDANMDGETLLVIAMDEVPIAIGNIAGNEGPEAANRLLQTLRSLRRQDSRLRWIVCGSIGFHHILRRCNATEGVLNDLVNLPLGPLEEHEAAELAERLFLGIRREPQPGAVGAVLTESGQIPFLVHALAHRLGEAGTGAVDATAVADAFFDFMDDRDESKAVTHLLSRLDEHYGDRTAEAEKLLDHVAQHQPVPVAELDGGILDDLIDDHYLVESRREVRWRYDVLRRIWMHRRRL
jgi:hypothetical protein